MARTRETLRKSSGGGPNCAGCRKSRMKYLNAKRPACERLSEKVVEQLKKLDEVDKALKIKTSAMLPLKDEAKAGQSSSEA